MTPALAAIGALVLGLGAGLAAGSDAESATTATAPGPVDIGFSQDMIVHHEQAVLMAQLVRARTRDATVAALADGIIADQLLDIGTLRGYLALWQAPVLPTGGPMSWMAASHEHVHAGAGAGSMPGMATAAELNSLRTATINRVDRVFLTLMSRHHAGGLAMLTHAGLNATVPAIRNLANRIGFHQQEEMRTIHLLSAA